MSVCECVFIISALSHSVFRVTLQSVTAANENQLCDTDPFNPHANPLNCCLVRKERATFPRAGQM